MQMAARQSLFGRTCWLPLVVWRKAPKAVILVGFSHQGREIRAAQLESQRASASCRNFAWPKFKRPLRTSCTHQVARILDTAIDFMTNVVPSMVPKFLLEGRALRFRQSVCMSGASHCMVLRRRAARKGERGVAGDDAALSWHAARQVRFFSQCALTALPGRSQRPLLFLFEVGRLPVDGPGA